MNVSYITPAVTFFTQDGQPDEQSNRALYEHLIAGGIDGILVLGSIGEFFAMPYDMRMQVARTAIAAVNRRTRLLIGTASMVFEEIAPMSNTCLDAGADAVIVVSPYYFPLDAQAMYAYYSRLAREIHGDIYLYNFPARTGYSLPTEVVLRLAQDFPNIVGIKDTIPGMDHTREMIEQIKPIRPDFEIYSGFDENLSANALSGGNGCIAGLSNIYPTLCSAAAAALRAEDMPRIIAYQRLIQKLFALYGIGSSFIPVIKEALRLRGIGRNTYCTFPIPAITDAQRTSLQALMAQVESSIMQV